MSIEMSLFAELAANAYSKLKERKPAWGSSRPETSLKFSDIFLLFTDRVIMNRFPSKTEYQWSVFEKIIDSEEMVHLFLWTLINNMLFIGDDIPDDFDFLYVQRRLIDCVGLEIVNNACQEAYECWKVLNHTLPRIQSSRGVDMLKITLFQMKHNFARKHLNALNRFARVISNKS